MYCFKVILAQKLLIIQDFPKYFALCKYMYIKKSDGLDFNTITRCNNIEFWNIRHNNFKGYRTWVINVLLQYIIHVLLEYQIKHLKILKFDN